jgi:hypothetical protein
VYLDVLMASLWVAFLDNSKAASLVSKTALDAGMVVAIARNLVEKKVAYLANFGDAHMTDITVALIVVLMVGMSVVLMTWRSLDTRAEKLVGMTALLKAQNIVMID